MRMTVTLQTNLKADNIAPEFENMYFCDEFGAKSNASISLQLRADFAEALLATPRRHCAANLEFGIRK